MARNQKVPDWVGERPDLEPGDEFFLRAFWDLSTERAIGMSLGPIPTSRLDSYGHAKGLDSDTMELFRVVIRMLDDTYLKWATDQQKRARENSSSG